MHKIPWGDLQYVSAVAEQGSLSAAARRLGVNHATVLRRISALEDVLGVKLFDRPPGGYRLRPEARDVLAAAQTIERAIDRLDRQLAVLGRGFDAAFRLTTTDSVAETLLARHLADLARVHPKLSVELVVTNNPVDMGRPDAEITLRPASAVPAGLVGKRISAMAFRVYARAEYWAAHPSARHSDHRWLVGAGPLDRSPVGAWRDAYVGEAAGHRADSFVTLARMAEAGLGPAMIPSFLARQSELLVRAPQFADETQTSFWAAAHPDLIRLEWVEALIDFFVESFAKDRDLLE